MVSASRQLLNRLLGEDTRLIDVRTADNLVVEVLRASGQSPKSTDEGQDRYFLKEARRRLYEGPPADREHARLLATLTDDYLTVELNRVIVGREHRDMAAYLADHRAGRRVPLNPAQRAAVWRLHEVRERLMQGRGLRTFAQNRRRAAELVRTGAWQTRYDGVIVDEAQDLDPVVLRLLVEVCKTSDRWLLTADPNQSIYGAGFRWADVHSDLRFRGRTGVLRRNYRSTKQITNAAAAYLAGCEIDEPESPDDRSIEHVRSGPLPTLRRVPDPARELYYLHRFLRDATKTHRVGYSSCAVLVPDRRIGLEMQTRLQGVGLRAEFMDGQTLDLQRPEIKVLTYQSSKGLKFPIVALAGLMQRLPIYMSVEATGDEIDEATRLARRVIYVAMTRAVHDLLVQIPTEGDSALFTAFNTSLWQVRSADEPGAPVFVTSPNAMSA